MNWRSVRREILKRDDRRCQACGTRVGKVWDAGHLQDRILGGSDDPDNVVVMCQRCNRTLKPPTPTPGKARAWMDSQQHPQPIDWEPLWQLASGKGPTDGTQTLAEHERLE